MKKCKVITVTAHKGGSGKTTTCCALADGLSIIPGNKVLLIDADGQASATRIYGVTPEEAAQANLYDVLRNSKPINSALIHHAERSDILPGTPALYGLSVELQNQPGRDSLLLRAIEPIKKDYTHIIIDTAPGINSTIIQALTAADLAIIPTGCDPMNYIGAIDALETCRQVIEYCNPSLKIAGLLITQYNNRTIISKQYEDLLRAEAKAHKVKVLSSHIRQGIAIKEAQALRTNLFKYAPKSKPAEDYQALIQELKL